ncbi:MAG: ferrous iron transport protein B [Chlamydiales bacterium]
MDPLAGQTTPAALTSRSVQIAVTGNPNTGKTTLFNRLTGSHVKVANYAGVTVDRTDGTTSLPVHGDVGVFDLPGTYSLSARSEEEQIAISALAGVPPYAAPDMALVVVDGTQLARNLYLVLQVIELDLPVVVAVNMVDAVEAQGQRFDFEALQRELGVPVVGISALKGLGLDELKSALAAVLEDPSRGRPGWRWQPREPELLEHIAAIGEAMPEAWTRGLSAGSARRDAFALWAMLSIDDDDELTGIPERLRALVRDRHEQARTQGRELHDQVIAGRFGWIDERSPAFLHDAQPGTSGSTRGKSRTDRIDSVLLHPIAGFAIFLLAMGVVFQSLFSWADPLIGLIESGIALLSGGVEAVLPASLFRDFLTQGLLAGVGSVIVFLPQILLLFFFLGIMEDTGYMARVAFLMDRVMKSLGLHGRAFVPMLTSFACAIPAVMATRTMERRRDRFLTMMVVPLMTCAARLPVYTLVIGALFPPSKVFGFLPVQGLLMIGMYLFSTVIALLCAAVLGRTLLKGPTVPLILELPPYRAPHWATVLRSMWRKGHVFLSEAGRVILVCTIALWLLLSFPNRSEDPSVRLRESYAGQLGRAIEPTIAPLGFDWKIGVGLIGAFAAREVFVSTMGIVYGIGDDVDEDSVTLREKIRNETHADGRPVYTPLVGLSLLIFFALACQCMSTLAAVRRETATWRWPVFLFVYMTGLAWVASFAVYQGGQLLGFT